ncbi:MAG: phosphate signaling complex protein PhoU [Anaerolineae bacterium]|nr:phosphate signaling complex protein PhoU [Anaerolineae bacterium]
MLRQTFEQKLQTLQTEVLLLGDMVDTALGAAVEALTRHDLTGAGRLVADNCFITQKRLAIEAEILSQIATQQPVAGDLRLLVAALEIAAELERMGSYAASIAQTTLSQAHQPLPEPFLSTLPAMGQKAREMLRQSLLALARRDIMIARAIPKQDDEVDRLYQEAHQALVVLLKTDTQGAGQATALSRVAHNLERTADRVLNICEWVIFAITGEMKELNGSAR